jgi:hypothetical protein
VLKRIFSQQQLSLFFQIAVLMNITGLFLDLVVYHYFSHNELFKLLAENLNNLSLFMICLTIISQALVIFTQRHQILVTKYKIAAIAIEACIGIFFVWLLTIENDIQGKVIIFSSSLSQFNHSYSLALILSAIFIMLLFDFYKNLITPPKINQNSVPEMLQSIFRLVFRRHLIMFIFMFGMVNFTTIHKFSTALFHHSRSLFIFEVSLLEFIIPIGWIVTIFYYLYQLSKDHNK